MPYHPADGPRLKTLYVTQSTRRRRRRSSSVRRRRNIALAVLGLVAVLSTGVVFRDKIGRRISKMIEPPHAPTRLVKDVTAPTPPATPAVNQAGTTISNTATAAAAAR